MRQIAQTYKLAVCQVNVVPNKQQTLQNVKKSVEEAVSNGAKIAVLGETFNTPYTPTHLKQNSENFQDLENCPTLQLLKELSIKHQIYITGSIPEQQGDKLFNTCVFFNKQGEIQGKYRKMHLFDIDIPGKATYKESDTFAFGDLGLQVVDTDLGKFGLAICYDIRFPEMSLALSKLGAQVLLFPANFSPATGPLHWDILLQGRALDNLAYVVGASTRRYVEDPSIYQSHGHSAIVDPMGKFVAKADEKEAILYHEINNDYIKEVRQNIPIYYQRQNSVYSLNIVENKE